MGDKSFNAVWGTGYVPGCSTVSVDYFNADNGYTPDDIAAISALPVGGVWVAPTPEEHRVTRLV